jgi:FHS family L-fucose permease-like MFS transporter
MMIVGGAIMPLIQGALMDAFGVRTSLAIVLVGYAYLVFFGFYGARADEATGDTAKSLSAGT